MERGPYVVGIGASAGGLDALERFFDHVPADTSLAFVVVQHLSPDFKSLMDELLARHTRLPIQLVEDGVTVEPGHVYLIPPRKEMMISGGRLLLSERDRQQELTLPIDVFFRSLGHDLGPRAVAVVLSGGGSDGSRGIRYVHDAGGLVVVQDEASAQFNGMPRSAREVGVAAYVLPPEGMARAIDEHIRDASSRPSASSSDLPPLDEAAQPLLAAAFQLLADEHGIDFSKYKPGTLTRRIDRRLRLAQAADLADYVARLRRDRAELDLLYRDLLIGVTSFFRNPDAFAYLEERVLPELMRQGAPDEELRVWVAGCATGEEAYSMAILLEEASARCERRPFKIFATDVHRGSLDGAARAFYDVEALANVSPERRERHFLRSGAGFQLRADLRQKVVFAQHDVLKDAPFTRVDLVSCRNMLIYLQPAAQHKVLGRFLFGLNVGGVLFLGPSESPGPLASELEPLHRHWKIFRKQSEARIPVDERLVPNRALEARLDPRRPPARLLASYDALLDELLPPGFLVDERGELIHAFAGASRFLRPRDGRPNLRILDLVDGDLKTVLGGGMARAIHASSPITYKGVRLVCEGKEAFHDVTLRRLPLRQTATPQIVVTIAATEEPRPEPRAIDVDVEQLSRAELAALHAELGQTKENLQAAIEELEASNEELQASNEELLASNEELQSTNEELQSVNEELYTVNGEYQRKIDELTELANDMDNLLASTDVGTIFLDSELRIRKFTPQIGESFNLLPQDIGRSIETFTTTIHHPRLADDVRRVLASGEPVELELGGQADRSFFLRILPYRAKGTVAGVAVTLIDVTSLKAAEDALFHERYLLNSLLGSVPDAIYFCDARGRFIRANRALTARLGIDDPSAAVGRTPFELTDVEAALTLHRNDEVVLRTGKPQLDQLERQTAPGGEVRWDRVTRLPLTDRSQAIVGVIGILRDVTDQKRAEERIQEAMRRRDEFLAMLSHELRNPLSAVVTAITLLKAGRTGFDHHGRWLEVVDRQSHQMARLLDDLLDASRVTQNKIELRRRRLDLRVVVKEAVEATRSLMEQNRLHFAAEIDPLPIYVDGDAARLQQVHVNLLNNAAKYTQAGGHVTIEARRERDEAVVRVTDDGAGIPPDLLGAIFELFVQSRRTLDRAQGGIGVGLTLVRSLVEMHGGSVDALSAGEGKGSTFIVRLPLADPAFDGWTERPARRPPPAKAHRVVLVEDGSDSRELLTELLEKAGFECRAAGDGASGLSLIDTVGPDVAIIDLGLPGMDGLELARRLRSEPRHSELFLVALTGYGQLADRANAFHAGFDEHLIKPVRIEQLVKLLRSPPS